MNKDLKFASHLATRVSLGFLENDSKEGNGKESVGGGIKGRC